MGCAILVLFLGAAAKLVGGQALPVAYDRVAIPHTSDDRAIEAGAAAGIVMWTEFGQAQVSPTTRVPPTIVIHVEDLAGLRPHVAESAEREVVRIYTLAGIHAMWKNTDSVTTEKDGVPNVTVRVLDAAATKRFAAGSGLDASALGAAVRGANRAYIFFPQVTLDARFYARHLGTLLGAAIAHEVGHLLLPQGTHSNVGIMRTNLGVRSLMPGRFTPSQAAEITNTLRTWQQRDSPKGASVN